MKQYNNKKKMMIMVLCVAIVLAGDMQASAMVTADDILAGRNATEVSSAQVVMVDVRRHIVGGTYRTLISVQNPLRLCRTGICRSLSAG
ncbi:MAG: hypothetical protein V8S23_03425 [Lachnospiraceae bacterium]